jgi:hypothetical protein
MPDTASITLVKIIPWRGHNEEWSNTYHFSGPLPADAATWNTLCLAWWDIERAGMCGDVKLVRAYGYAPGNVVNVWTHDYTVGTIPSAGSQGSATGTGELTVTCSFTTAERNSKGRPVHGIKYYHGVIVATGGTANRDLVDGVQRGAFTTNLPHLYDGTLPAGVKYCMPQGAAVTGVTAKTNIGEHQFKRRGKRPH